MNSSERISPGVTHSNLFIAVMILMIVDNGYIPFECIPPSEDDSPLVINPNTPKALQVTTQ